MKGIYVWNRLYRLRPVLILTLLLDQATKLWAGLTLSPLVSNNWLGGLLSFVCTENIGAVSGIGTGLSQTLKVGLFTLMPCLSLLVVIFILERISSISLLACSLIVSSILIVTY